MYPQLGRIRAKSPPYLTIVIHRQMMSYLQIALHSPVTHHPRTMRKPSPERDHHTIPVRLSVARIAGREERPTGTGPIQSWPLSICLPGSRVWPPTFYLRTTRSGRPPPCTQHLIPPTKDHMTCYLPPWASDSCRNRVPDQQYLYPKGPTAVAKLLQYSGLGSNSEMGFLHTSDSQ